MTTSETRGTIQVIERAAKMMRLVGQAPDGLTQTEISQRLELARSTVHRILRALQREGLVDNADGSRFRLGPTFGDLASSNRQQIISMLHPYLVNLGSEVDETVQLALLEDDHTVLVDQVVSGRDLRIESEIGTTRPLHSTAKGKAILAQLSDESVRQLLRAKLPRFTANTITSAGKLMTQISDVRQGHCVWSGEEWTLGISSVAVALPRLPLGPASASILVPSHRLAGNEARFERALLSMARHVESSFTRAS